MNEYIIINKTAIQQRIEELEKEIEFYNKVGALSINPNKVKAETELSLLKQLLSQSTPLIPEIEKAFDASKITTAMNQRNQFAYKYKTSQDYISNLKLDI